MQMLSMSPLLLQLSDSCCCRHDICQTRV